MVVRKRVRDVKAIVARQMKAQDRNQKIADKIIKEMDERGCHLRIGVSSVGLHFYPMDAHSRDELAKLLRQKPTLKLALKGKL